MGSTEIPPTNIEQVLSPAERKWATERNLIAETVAAKRAILEALGMDKGSPELWKEIEVHLEAGNRVYVKAAKFAQQRVWALRAIDYKVAFNRRGADVTCTATAIADVGDMSN